MARVFKRGRDWWIDFLDEEGRRHRKKIGPNYRVAQDVLHDILAKVAKAEYLGVVEERKIGFTDFCREYLERYARTRLSPRSYEREEGIIRKHFIPFFKGYLKAITRSKIEAYMAQRLEGGASPTTVAHEFSRLRHMLNWAVGQGYLKRSPAKGVKPPKPEPGRLRYLTAEELARLMEALEPSSLMENPYNKGDKVSDLVRGYLKPLVILAINTGCRLGELLSLEWKDVNLRERFITLEHTKNNERRIVPLNQEAYEAIKGLPRRIDTERLFPFTRHQVHGAFYRAVRRAGIKDFRFHDLRHTFASYLAMSGANMRTIQELLGHKDMRMTLRYSHLSPAHLKEAVNNLKLPGEDSELAPMWHQRES